MIHLFFQGDSGGPLLHQLANGRWVNIGIVSWGIRCGDPGYPGIYTRVNSYLDWIFANAVFWESRSRSHVPKIFLLLYIYNVLHLRKTCIPLMKRSFRLWSVDATHGNEFINNDHSIGRPK